MIDRQRWDTIREIFDAALELPPSERDAFIQSASQGDVEICSEVGLLLRAEDDAGDFLEAPMAPGSLLGSEAAGNAAKPPLQPGDMLCNRFRILRLVGEGGMGHVFEAWDTELNHPVALKAIRPEIASHPESLRRFRREVSLALSITHPNVCRTFDLERDQRVVDAAKGTTQDIVFLTMEFLNGETLSDRIARGGPIPLNEAQRIAGHIAAALDSAHALGILHRDIKPANVMLVQPAVTASTPASSVASASLARAVITDFGLARQDALFQATEQSAISRSGFPAGTLAYMAPEQLEAGPTSVATDIYAFGLVLFEMVAGRRAFPSSSPLSGIRQRLAGPPPTPKSLVPDLPESWCRAIEGCLRTHAADRYQSAADVIEVLKGRNVALPRVRSASTGLWEITMQMVRAPGAAWWRWSVSLRILTAAIFIVLTMSLSYGVLRFLRVSGDSAQTASVKPGALVYLTQVKNETGERNFGNLTELLQAGLTQSTQINLLDKGHVEDTLRNMTLSPDSKIDEITAREIALRTGAARVIFCKITGTNGSYQLSVDIQRPDGNLPSRSRSQAKESFSWRRTTSTNTATIPPELLSVVRDTTTWIRMKVGESQNDIGQLDAPPEDVTTGNWQALAEFTRAEEFARQQKLEQAISTLKEAVRLDPNFALAYARLGDISNTLGHTEEAYSAYQNALDHEADHRLTRRERDRIRGIYALDTYDYATAEAAFRDYQEYFSHDYTGWFFRAFPLMMLGRTEEAISSLKHAHEIDPQKPSAITHLADCYFILGDDTEAEHWIDALKTTTAQQDAYYYTGNLKASEHDWPAAEKNFRLLFPVSPLHHAVGESMLARIAMNQGQSEIARQHLIASSKIYADAGLMPQYATALLDEASVECTNGLVNDCLQHIKKALDLSAGPVNAIYASGILGRALAARSASNTPLLVDLLEGIAGSLPQHPTVLIGEIAALRVSGEIFLAKGQAHEALSAFRKASALEAPTSDQEYLARALLSVASSEKDAAKVHQLRLEAMNAYGRVALHQNFFWQQATRLPSGILTEETWKHMRLSHLLSAETTAVVNQPRAR